MLKATADFPDHLLRAHINVLETFAFHEVLKLAVDFFPQTVKGAALVVDVDNQTMHGAFRRESGKNADMHEIIKKLFWLQAESYSTLKLRWVRSEGTKVQSTSHDRRLQNMFA